MSAAADPGDAEGFSKPAPAPRGLAGAFERLLERALAWRDARIASPAFQSWAARFPLTRGVARRDAERLYDLTAGFVYSQTLLACVELGLLEALRGGPLSAEALGERTGLPAERAALLCQAASAIGLTARRRDGRYRLGRLGAATLGAPGLAPMIRHHRLFYQDLADPVALLKHDAAPGETALSQFWPYVRGGAVDPTQAATYSALMAASQMMVAEETLAVAPLRDVRRLLDIGGGAGAFLIEAARRWPRLEVALLDLPAVAAVAEARFAEAGLADRARAHGGGFLDAPLPEGADAISLVRVLYDHDDKTAIALLRRVREALPPGGLLLISEPMSGGTRPSRAGDAYFGFYTLAMTSGRPRSAERHAELLTAAGFERAA
ncbi:MAG: methyltransferase, partial [Pseudomonadota bacterium]